MWHPFSTSGISSVWLVRVVDWLCIRDQPLDFLEFQLPSFLFIVLYLCSEQDEVSCGTLSVSLVFVVAVLLCSVEALSQCAIWSPRLSLPTLSCHPFLAAALYAPPFSRASRSSRSIRALIASAGERRL